MTVNHRRLYASCVLAGLCTLATSYAPPHPEYTSFENDFPYRHQLNITYTSKHYPAEHCRFMSEEDCRAHDERVAQAVHRRRQLVADRRLNPSKGTLKILVLLVYFPEHSSILSSLPGKDHFEEILNGQGTSSVNPAGSLKEWEYVNSLKTMDVEFVIQDWSKAEQSEAYYANNEAGRGDMPRIEDIFRSKLEALDAAGFDFSPFDSDQNGYLDGVMTFHSGVPAELGDAPCATDVLQRVWAQAIRGPLADGWMSSDGLFQLDGFTVSGALTRPLCSDDGKQKVYTPTNIAIATHELGHTWQLEDYYDQTPGETGIAGLGAYDIMSNAYGWTFDGTHPGYTSVYNKIKAGYMEATPITQDGLYAIQPIELSSLAYMISDPYPEGEYLLIECRYPYRWSSDWTGQGIVIYHVDENAPLMTERGYPGKSGWPAKHYRIAVQQKDGKYDIENNVNLGDATDFWLLNDELGPGPDKWPNTDSIQGTQTQTGLTIKITSGPSLIMQFQVSGLKKWSSSAPGFAPGDGSEQKAATSSELRGSNGETATGNSSIQPTSGGFRARLPFALLVIGATTATLL